MLDTELHQHVTILIGFMVASIFYCIGFVRGRVKAEAARIQAERRAQELLRIAQDAEKDAAHSRAMKKLYISMLTNRERKQHDKEVV